MEFKFSTKASRKDAIYIIEDAKDAVYPTGLSDAEAEYVRRLVKEEVSIIPINHYDSTLFMVSLPACNSQELLAETLRKKGADLCGRINALKLPDVTIHNTSSFGAAAIHLAEGLALSNYQFLKYKTEPSKKENRLKTIAFDKGSATKPQLAELQTVIDAVYAARTLVNEPLNAMTAVDLANAFEKMGKDSGFKVKVLHKKAIEKEGMGGLLAVNLGSQDPPTFTIMEHKPAKALNAKPIVLVGKGVVYDTGGLSLKPTPNSMDRMKSDMSGAALVGATMQAIAQLNLPLHVIALVPATDNRPGENAYVPGDVITMYSGATVEVLNTDAEGRLLLGDALHWAKRYNPELVLDFATLTGAASVAVGEHGIVCMGTADERVKTQLRAAGERQYERLVEYPLWSEYGEQIKSDIADIKNVGGPSGGAITAGKFLEHFTSYPWMHFDIAGVSFATAKRNYQTIGGTAFGLRMLLDFLQSYTA
ncbi:MAG: leucyl aminopeptidase [Sphingobacteriales bacterium]|nr:MAG: leucyl aminopeptidase [Sphingobacteriales bacterium]